MKKNKIFLLGSIIFVFGIFLATTLKITDRYSFEYPSCLLLREIKLWNIRVYYRKYETWLSRYMSNNNIRVNSLRKNNFIVSEKTLTLHGLEQKNGGTGTDLLKLNVFISNHKFQIKKDDFYSLLESLSFDPAKFQEEVWNLVYRCGGGADDRGSCVRSFAHTDQLQRQTLRGAEPEQIRPGL